MSKKSFHYFQTTTIIHDQLWGRKMKVQHMVVHRRLFLLINLNENRTQFFKVNGSLVLKKY